MPNNMILAFFGHAFPHNPICTKMQKILTYFNRTFSPFVQLPKEVLLSIVVPNKV